MRTIMAMSVLLVATAIGFAAEVVVPNAYATSDGDTWNRIPWAYSQELRYQQVYLGSQVGSGEITEIRFRQDPDWGFPFSHTLAGITIIMASTSAVPGALSPIFADNLGGAAITVYSGDLSLASASSTAVPRPFDIIVPLTTPFTFDASGGANLILDVAVPNPPENVVGIDGSYDSSVSRLFCVGPGCATSDLSSEPGDGIGLVTQFVIVDASLIFNDGFETGDTSEWSGSVP